MLKIENIGVMDGVGVTELFMIIIFCINNVITGDEWLLDRFQWL